MWDPSACKSQLGQTHLPLVLQTATPQPPRQPKNMLPIGWSRLEPLGGQCHDPGNLKCNGGEEGGMVLVPLIVLHQEAWLEDAWRRAFQQEGLRAGPWLSGGKQVVVKNQTNKQVIYFILFLFFKIFIGVSCFTMLCEFLLYSKMNQLT